MYAVPISHTPPGTASVAFSNYARSHVLPAEENAVVKRAGYSFSGTVGWWQSNCRARRKNRLPIPFEKRVCLPLPRSVIGALIGR